LSIPDLVHLSNYSDTNYVNYINEIYEIFKYEVAEAKLQFLGLPITCQWCPPYDNKHFSFWHLITNKFESDKEEDRQPDIRRCERIRWIAYVIKNANDFEKIWCWEKQVKTKRGRSTHIALYLHEEHYLVILRKKPNRLEVATAYVKENHCVFASERSSSKDPRESYSDHSGS